MPERAWILLPSGKQLDLLDPDRCRMRARRAQLRPCPCLQDTAGGRGLPERRSQDHALQRERRLKDPWHKSQKPLKKKTRRWSKWPHSSGCQTTLRYTNHL